MSIDSRTGRVRCWIILGICGALCLLVPAAVQAQEKPAGPAEASQPSEITALRQEIDELKKAYEERIAALEKRLTDLEAAGGPARRTERRSEELERDCEGKRPRRATA